MEENRQAMSNCDNLKKEEEKEEDKDFTITTIFQLHGLYRCINDFTPKMASFSSLKGFYRSGDDGLETSSNAAFHLNPSLGVWRSTDANLESMETFKMEYLEEEIKSDELDAAMAMPNDTVDPGTLFLTDARKATIISGNERGSLLHSVKPKTSIISKVHRCNLCSHSFSTISGLKKHRKNHHKLIAERKKTRKVEPDTFKCRYCPEDFPTRDELDKHKTSHSDLFTNTLVCDHCGHKCGNRRDMVRHLQNHIEMRPQCPICKEHYANNFTLHLHMKRHCKQTPKPTLTEYVCTVCRKVLGNIYSYLRHAKLHYGGEYKCELCVKTFGQKIQLRNHVLKHFGIKEFKCSMCDQSYTSRENLVYHVRRHTGEKPYVCSVCGRRFSHPASYSNHMKTHYGGQFSCPICEKKCVRKHDLKCHLLKHEGVKPFKCHYCGKTYSRKETLRKHVEKHNYDGPRFLCTICGMNFLNSNGLSKHVSEHNVKKIVFNCEHCGANFNDKTSLSAHEVNHRLSAAYKCDLCVDYFNDIILYRRHMIVSHRQILKLK